MRVENSIDTLEFTLHVMEFINVAQTLLDSASEIQMWCLSSVVNAA